MPLVEEGTIVIAAKKRHRKDKIKLLCQLLLPRECGGNTFM